MNNWVPHITVDDLNKGITNVKQDIENFVIDILKKMGINFTTKTIRRWRRW